MMGLECRSFGSEEEQRLQELASYYHLQLTLAVERLDESRLCGMTYLAYLAAKREAKAFWGTSIRETNRALRVEVRKNERAYARQDN